MANNNNSIVIYKPRTTGRPRRRGEEKRVIIAAGVRPAETLNLTVDDIGVITVRRCLEIIVEQIKRQHYRRDTRASLSALKPPAVGCDLTARIQQTYGTSVRPEAGNRRQRR